MSAERKVKASDLKSQLKIRLSDEEKIQIAKLSEAHGTSPQNIFRKMLLGAAVPTVVLHPESARAILSELRRIGNNINQISFHLNSGSARGWFSEFEEAASTLLGIEHLIRKHLGYR